MADREEARVTDEENIFLCQKREKKDLQGGDPRTNEEFARRIHHAQSAPFCLGSTFPPALQQMISLYSASFSCPEQGVLFPLLSVCGACIGPTGILEVTPDWTEPPILWTLVVTSASPFAHNNNLVEHLQEKILALQSDLKVDTDFLLEYFDLDALHRTIIQSNGKALGLFTNIASLESIINGNPFLGQMLPKLFNGGSWLVNTANHQGSLSKTCLGLVGQTDPKTLQRYFSISTSFARILKTAFVTVVTKDKQDSGNLLSAQSLLDLKNVFLPLNSIHAAGVVKYRLCPDAQQLFVRFRNEYLKKSQSESCSLMKEILQMAPRLLARLALLLHALETVLEVANWGLVPDLVTWNVEISSDTLWSARLLLDFSLLQKRALLVPYEATNPVTCDADNKVGSSSEVVVISSVNDSTSISNKNPNEEQSTDSSINSQQIPTIVSVTSAGITLEQQPGESGRLACELLPTFNFPPSLSLSILPNAVQTEPVEHIEITSDLNTRCSSSKQISTQLNRVQTMDLTDCHDDVSPKCKLDISPDTTPQKGYQSRTNNELISDPSTGFSNKPVRSFERVAPAETISEHSPKLINSRCLPVSHSDSTCTPDQTSKLYRRAMTSHSDTNPNYTARSYAKRIPPLSYIDRASDLTSKNLVNPLPTESISDIDNITCKEFFATHKSQVFKVLTMKTVSITPSRAVQLKLFRDRPVSYAPFKPKYSCNYARKALTHIENLGFGTLGSSGTNGRIVSFHKKLYSELGVEQLEMMKELCISQQDYEECFYVKAPLFTPLKATNYNVCANPIIGPADPTNVQNSSSPVQNSTCAGLMENYEVEVID